jgi:hypothetical protein
VNKEIRAGDWRRLYVLQHPFLVTVSLALALTGAMLLASPPLFDNTVIARALPSGLEYPWDTMLVLGGGSVLWGVWRLDARLEIVGLILQATALGVWAFVFTVETMAGRQIVSVLPVSLAGSVALGMSIRAFMLAAEPEVRAWNRRSS